MVRTLAAATSARVNLFRRLRVQVGFGLVLAIFLPWLILMIKTGWHPVGASVNVVMAASAFAFLLGVWQYRNLSIYPGVEGSANILSSFSISYGIVAIVFLLWRLEYTRMLLLSSYLLALAWFYFLYFAGERERNLKIGVLGVGDTLELKQLDGIDWVTLDDPDRIPANLNGVAADLRNDIPDEWDRRLADITLAGIPVFHAKHLLESLTGQVRLEHMGENSFGTLMPDNSWKRIKRLLDMLAALIGLLLIWPVLIVVGILIRLDSPGPALFKQVRTGYRGEPFTVIKFRTMRAEPVGSERLDVAKTKEDDPRITRLGAFLRRSRIDELPQLINVLKGEMSFIGPRPEAEVLSNHYEAMIPFYRYRHIVYPGISGWAQVNQGHVTEVDEIREKLHYDFYYIKNFSAWLDLLIVAKTIRTMLTGFGSK